MRKLGLIAAGLALCLTPVLWVLDAERFVMTFGAIAWILGLAFLAAALIRTGVWALDRLNEHAAGSEPRQR